MKLNDKQKRFVDEYLIDLNATQAAIRAGYSKTSARQQGQRLLTKDDIRKALEVRMEEKEEKRIMKQDEILKRLTAIARNEETEEVVLYNSTLQERRMTAKDRLKALELLGKRYAMFTDKQQVEDITPIFIDDVPYNDD